MENENTCQDAEVICDCSGTTRGKIKQLVAQGIVDADTISRKTGAISGCGSCEWDIEALLDDIVLKSSDG